MQLKENRRPSVLIVEDEFLVGEMISTALVARGFEVHLAVNADEALRFIVMGLADVLFTDINLPGEMDGAALARCARVLKPGIAVLYASGKTRMAEQLPGSIFLPKPYDPNEVCALIERLAKTVH
jgi:CheY-like chemotaxis protein